MMGLFSSRSDNGWELAFGLFSTVLQVPGLLENKRVHVREGCPVEDALRLTNGNCRQVDPQTELLPCVAVTLVFASGTW